MRLLVVIAAALTLAAITAPLPTAAAAPNVVAEPDRVGDLTVIL